MKFDTTFEIVKYEIRTLRVVNNWVEKLSISKTEANTIYKVIYEDWSIPKYFINDREVEPIHVPFRLRSEDLLWWVVGELRDRGLQIKAKTTNN